MRVTIFLIFNDNLFVRLDNGGDYLFQASDEDQMNLWVDSINRQAAGQDESGQAKSQTLPPGSDKKDEPKKRSFLRTRFCTLCGALFHALDIHVYAFK